MMTVEDLDQNSLLLTPQEIQRVHTLVKTFLPSSFDQDFVADTIVIKAWLKGLDHISRLFIRQKCISEWRRGERELRKNERYALYHAQQDPSPPDPELITHQKTLIDDALRKVLTPFERRILWYRFYDNQTLAQIAQSTNLPVDDVREFLRTAIYKLKVELT